MGERPRANELLEAIRATVGQPTLDWACRPEPLIGGFWAQMWRIRLDTNRPGLGGELVARVMPEPAVAAREIAVQSFLARVGYPTPIIRLSSSPGPHLDRAWMLMDHAPGRTLLAELSGPAALARLPRLARALPDRLAHHAAALHAVDPAPLRDIIDGQDQLDGLRRQAAAIERADLVAVAERLDSARPSARRVVVCHGDLHPFNILTHPSGDTVLDWSAAQIADPAYDVAFTQLLLANPPLPAPRPLRPAIAAAGRMLAARFTRTYDRWAQEPVDRGRLDWYGDLHALRILTKVATWHANDEVDQHASHPYLDLTTALAPRLGRRRSRSGADSPC